MAVNDQIEFDRSSTTEKITNFLHNYQGLPWLPKITGSTITAEKIILEVKPLPSTSLLDLVDRYPQGVPLELTVSILNQLVEMVVLLHNYGLVHTDLRAENMLYSEGVVILANFSSCKPFVKGTRALVSHSGSPHYSAPEIWHAKTFEGPEVDVWSLGVTAFVLATSHFPFGGTNPTDILRSIEARALWFPHFLPHRYRNLVAGMLRYDPQTRWNMSRIQEQLASLSGRLCKSSSSPWGDLSLASSLPRASFLSSSASEHCDPPSVSPPAARPRKRNLARFFRISHR